MSIRAISYGGGVDSTALLVLAARKEIDCSLALFADVGRAENPDTIAYLNSVAIPFAVDHGIAVEIVQRTRRDGTPVDLWDDAIKPSRTIPIPMRMSNGAPGNRTCTYVWKIRPIASVLKARGATNNDPAILELGITVDEYQRMNVSRIPWITNNYPLVDMGVTRDQAVSLIASASLPIPPKSSCIWCPYKRKDQWLELKNEHPDRFDQAVEFERQINEKRANIGRDAVWLHSSAKPLEQAVVDTLRERGQTSLFDDGPTCNEAGYCFI